MNPVVVVAIVALSFNRRLKPKEVPERLDELVQIVNMFPEYLYRG